MKNIKSYILINDIIYKASFLLLFLITMQSISAQDWGEWNADKIIDGQVNSSELRGKKVSESLVRYYQKNVSPKQGKKCPAFPSCSSFTLNAMNRYGTFLGFIMGLDRMYFRENFDMKYLKHYRIIQIENGGKRIYDPVDANNIFKKKGSGVIEPASTFNIL